jgi:hypothetical protein
MKEQPLIIYDDYQSEAITDFLDLLRARKCIYYASEFLGVDNENLSEVEDSVQHTLQIFKTLDVPAEEHFYSVFRYKPGYMFKDWKLSELACAYMLVNGDPSDIKTVAKQQNELIKQILSYIPARKIVEVSNA